MDAGENAYWSSHHRINVKCGQIERRARQTAARSWKMEGKVWGCRCGHQSRGGQYRKRSRQVTMMLFVDITSYFSAMNIAWYALRLWRWRFKTAIRPAVDPVRWTRRFHKHTLKQCHFAPRTMRRPQSSEGQPALRGTYSFKLRDWSARRTWRWEGWLIARAKPVVWGLDKRYHNCYRDILWDLTFCHVSRAIETQFELMITAEPLKDQAWIAQLRSGASSS